MALLCTVATTVDSKPSHADTIPDTVPWLADLECETYFKILAQAQLEVFGDTVQVASLAGDTFLVDDGTVTDIDPTQPESTAVTEGLSWILPALNRQHSDQIRFPLSYDPDSSPRVVSIRVADEDIQAKVSGTLMVTIDSGITQNKNEVLTALDEQGKLIAGPLLKKDQSEPDTCVTTDTNGHRARSFGFTYGPPEMALVAPGEPLPITHFEVGGIDQNNFSSWEAVINGILLAAKLQAQVLNISIGGPATPEVVEKLILAMNYAKENGVIIFISAGNSNNEDNMPACLFDEHIFRVLALQDNGGEPGLWPLSNTDCTDMVENSIAAPGSQIPSFDQFGEPAMGNGTSMAAPVVSFVASLDAIGQDGQPLSLVDRISNFKAHLTPPPLNSTTRRPDTYWRVKLDDVKIYWVPVQINFLPLLWQNNLHII